MPVRMLALSVVVAFLASNHAWSQDRTLVTWKTQRLSDVFFAEGAGAGDFNSDGHTDLVIGPYWYEGPTFETSHAYSSPKPFDPRGYSDNFFAYSEDFNRDGWTDILIIGFPGQDASWFENPQGKPGMWLRHKILDVVDNESPTYADITGDGQREIVCSSGGFFGFAGPNTEDARQPWAFRRISDNSAGGKFTHGLGVGDVNGDGKVDLLEKNGWWQQPASLDGDSIWKKHSVAFAGPGGAQMFAYDFDGDGDNDVLTSLAAHGHGLAWYEHIPTDGAIQFKRHDIVGDTADTNRYGVVFSQLHAIDLADIDGDGIKDIVTGKRYWAHGPNGDPDPGAPAVLYWFRTVRTGKPGEEAVDFVPQLVHDDSGVGVEVKVVDVNGDRSPDIIVGNKKGAFVHIQERKQVARAEWERRQPLAREHAAKPSANGLPPNAGLTPEEAAKAITVPAGFHVQLAAGEPLVHQPVAFTFDDRGRIWVAEAYTYPQRAPEGQGKDKIVILEDTDLDGMFETRKVFIEGLNLVSGLEVGFGGVWVGAPPYLMFIPDRDRDDKPDPPPAAGTKVPNSGARGQPNSKDVPAGAMVLLGGFGWHDTHETLNSFIWGPDGWLYGCHGVFTHSHVGPPGVDYGRVLLNAGVWRYHPTHHRFQVFAHGTSNPWGVDFNDYGQAFITACVIPHLYHVIQGGRYQRQAGQHFQPYTFDDIKTIADHAHYAGNIADHAWWGRDNAVAHSDTDHAGGGHAHAGAMIYLGDNWPDRYRNTLFMSNIHGNRINNDILRPHGSGYVGSHGQDFLFANDRWFRAINLKYGPDGAVYIIDWYDKNACHRHQSEIWDRTNGRIYRVTYGDRKPERINLAKLSDMELVDLQLHQNDWYVRTARRLLHERNTDLRAVTPGVGSGFFQVGGSSGGGSEIRPKELLPAAVRDRLTEIATTHSNVTRRLRAAWALTVINASHRVIEPFLTATGPGSEHLRAWGIRLHTDAPSQYVSHEQREKWDAMLLDIAKSDPSPIVRLQLASRMQTRRIEEQWDIARALIGHAEDADDHNLPLMYWYGVERFAMYPDSGVGLAKSSKIPLVTQFIYRRAASEGKTLAVLLEMLRETRDEATLRQMLDEIVAVFRTRASVDMPAEWPPVYEQLSKSKADDIRQKAQFITVKFGDKSIFPALRGIVADAKAEHSSRLQALEALVTGKDEALPELLQRLLSDQPIRRPALRALAQIPHPKTGKAILSQYPALTDDEQQDAITTLAARPQTALELLAAIETKKVPREDLSAFTVGQMQRLNDESVVKRLNEVWGAIRSTPEDKLKLIAEFKGKFRPSLLAAADLSSGRVVYVKTCAKCHRLFGEGGLIGPDITGSNRANLDYVLENILDPSAVVGRDYQLTVIETKDGRLVSGLVKEENESAVVLQTVNEVVVVGKSDIEDRQKSNVSMMPDGQLQQLPPDEARDLIAYLASPTQVPLPGEGPAYNPQTRRVSGALEGETLKVLAKTGGDAGPQKMDVFPKDRWSGDDHLWWTGAKPGDKLTLELPVKESGTYEVFAVMTKARDYGIVQLALDDAKIGPEFDLFNSPDVITTRAVSLGTHQLTAGKHRLSIEIAGANPQAVKAYMFGLDYVYLAKKVADSKQ